MKKKNLCKKCNKPLPGGYKYDECEHCRGKKAGLAKQIIRGAVLSIGLLIVTKGKIGGKK